jgi:GntR family transcriptional regulator
MKNGISLYTRVESLLRTRILSGQYEPGQKLPTAKELAAQFGVSKITINSALGNLQREALIFPQQGKGTFVSESIPVSKQFVLTGPLYKIIEDAERYDVQAFNPEVVNMGGIRFTKDMQMFFGVSSDHQIGRIQRIRLLKDVPIYFVENFLSPEIANSITKEDLQKEPLLRILRKKFGISPGKGEMYIQAVPAESDIAKFLHVETYDPLMHIQVHYWKPSGEPLEAANSFMRADYFKYKIEIDQCGMNQLK